MNNFYAYTGKRIADRFELVSPVSPQPKIAHASVWIAQDTIRSIELRAIVIDPDFPRITRVLDEARKTSFLDNNSDAIANMVSTIAVVSDDGDNAIFTEIPPGQPLTVFLSEQPLPPTVVHSLIGDVVSAINLSKSHGIRHLALTPDDIYLTDAGDIVIDGYGIQAALNDVPNDLSSDVLDQYEVVGLVHLLAHLLTGKAATVTELGKIDDELVQGASEISDLPAELSNLLAEIQAGDIPQSPNELLLKLVPWDDVDMSILLPHKCEPETKKPLANAIFPKVFDDAEPAEDEPEVSNDPAEIVVEKSTNTITNARRRASEGIAAVKNIDLNKRVNTSQFVITILVIAIVIVSILAIIGLFRPLREVTVKPPKPQVTDVEDSEISGPLPVIANISLVDPDSKKFFPPSPVPNSPETVQKAIDGKANTSWLSWYFNSPDMGDISGIGLHLTFEAKSKLSGITLDLDGKGGNLQIRTGDDPQAGDVVYEGPVNGNTHITFDHPVKTSDILLWFTKLPADNEGLNRISLAEITVE